MLAHEDGEADEEARGEYATRVSSFPLSGEEGDRPPEGEEHEHLGRDRVHVVGEEGRAVDEVQDPGHEPPAVVAEEGARCEGGEGQHEEGGQQADRQHPATEQDLPQGVEAVQEWGPVVDEVDVQGAPVQQRPRAHEGRGLVEVEEGHGQKRGAGEKGEGDEEGETTGVETERLDRPAHSGAPRATSYPNARCRRLHQASRRGATHTATGARIQPAIRSTT